MNARPRLPIITHAPVNAWLNVDARVLAANHEALAGWRPGVEVAAVVKCDGYGLGAGAVTRALFAAGCRTFFVANAEEGAHLRKISMPYGRDVTIYAFDGPTPGRESLLWDADVRPVLNSIEQIDRWRAHAKGRGAGPAPALHVDTGMNRLGLRVDEVGEAIRRGDLHWSLVMSHFACSEEDVAMNFVQREAFGWAASFLPDVPRSLSNSEGHIGGLAPGEDMARVGLAHAGARLCLRPGPALRAAAALRAPIVQIRDVAAGETIGYGASVRLAEAKRVAIVAAGYGDGLPRNDPAAGEAEIGGTAAPVLGRVSMDLTALDISGLRAGAVRVGDVAVFFGPTRAIETAAAAFRRTPYEMLTGLTARVERRIGGDAT